MWIFIFSFKEYIIECGNTCYFTWVIYITPCTYGKNDSFQNRAMVTLIYEIS